MFANNRLHANRRVVRLTFALLVASSGSVLSSTGIPQDESKLAEEAAAGKPGENGSAAAKTSEIKLVHAGKEPGQALRLVVAKGTRQDVVLTSRHQRVQKTKGGVQIPPAKLPSRRTTIRILVEDVAAGGDMTCRFTFLTAEPFDMEDVSPRVVKTVTEQAKAIQGYAGTMVLSNRGLVRSVGYDEPRVSLTPAQQMAIDGVKGMVKELAIPFPEEPVGIGGRWSVSRPVDNNGIRTVRVETYELTKLENATATVQVLVEQTARNQQLPAAAGSKARVTILSLESKGSGYRILSLSNVVPRKGTLTVVVKGEMLMEYLGQKQERLIEERILSEFVERNEKDATAQESEAGRATD